MTGAKISTRGIWGMRVDSNPPIQTNIPVRGRVVVLNCQRSRYADWWIWIDAPASARGREKSLELYSILWSDWPTSKQKVSRHGKSFCCSGSLTLFFGGREVTTRNTSAVRRLTTPSYHNKPKIRNSPTKLKRKSLLKALAFLARWLKRERKVKQPHWKTAVKFLSSLRALSKAKWWSLKREIIPLPYCTAGWPRRIVLGEIWSERKS